MQGGQFDSVQQYKSDVAFRTLVEGINENLYFIPKYQRKFRWREEQVHELARSLVRGYPIPPIYAYRNNAGQLEILDGQQRIMSLYFYYIGKFINSQKISAIDYRKLGVSDMKYSDVLEENYELVELVTYLKEDSRDERIDISYSNLPMDLKRKVDYTTITVIELRWDVAEKRILDIQKIFENLNARGTKLSPQEVRNGVYNCEFYDMLREVNEENSDWKKIRGRESDKEDDMEMLLRLCTVVKNVSWNGEEFVINNYHSKYSDWMDEFSEYVMDIGHESILEYRMILQEFFACFNITRVLNLKKALIESLFVVTKILNINIKITDEIIDRIINDETYKRYSRQGMVKKNQMNGRWKAVYEVLSKDVK